MIYLSIYIITCVISFMILAHGAHRKNLKFDADGVSILIIISAIGPVTLSVFAIMSVCHVLALALNKLYGSKE